MYVEALLGLRIFYKILNSHGTTPDSGSQDPYTKKSHTTLVLSILRAAITEC